MFDEGDKKCLVFELMRGGELLDKIVRQKFFRSNFNFKIRNIYKILKKVH